MIAFVGSSMASDIAEKEVAMEDSKEIMTETIESILGKPTPLDCTKYKFYYYNHLISQGASPSEASSGSYSVYFNCMGQTL